MQGHSRAELGSIHLWPLNVLNCSKQPPRQPFLGLTHLEEHVVTRGPPLCSFECSAEAPSISKKSSNTRFLWGLQATTTKIAVFKMQIPRSRDKLLDPDLQGNSQT